MIRNASRRPSPLSALLLAVFLAASPLTCAQDTPQPRFLLKQGTPVQLKLAQDVDAKYAVVGEPVELALAEDLRVSEVVVVKQGARVIGTVTSGKQKDRRGEANALALRVEFLKAGANTILLTGDSAAAGKRNANQMIAGTVFFGVTGLILTSRKHCAIPAGTSATSYVAEDVELPAVPAQPNAR